MTADERIKQLEAEVAHWKANHTNEVRRARILKDRPDMPIERVRAYEQWGAYQQQLVAEIERKMSAAAFILKQLAASQAREQQLREVIDRIGITSLDARQIADDTLTIPQDTTALEAMIAEAGEVMRERCERESWLMAPVLRSIPGVTLEDLK